ncbi:MAG TPA: CHC2 zinc finger domain-containing protein [Methanofastidiosum sp.]|nr:CHC2 zinc finger domain-containing protein [Methanofastidiosum sp.]
MIQISVLKVLEDLGIEYKAIGKGNVRIKCLNPNHHENNPSMDVHVESGVFYCFGCQAKGNLVSLLRLKGIENVRQYLRRFVVGGTTEEEIYKNLEKFVMSRSEFNYEADPNSPVELPPARTFDYNFYLAERGITEKEWKEWDMSIITDSRHMGWILIPIYQDKILRNYFIRDTFGSGKRYGPYPRNDILFGLDASNDLSKKIYVTEGIFDTIFFRRTRNQCVAALSNRLLPDQINRLKRYPEVVIVPDNDEMGKFLIISALALIHDTKVSVCRLPEGKKDAADCSLEELLESTYKEVSILDVQLEAFEQSLRNMRVIGERAWN